MEHQIILEILLPFIQYKIILFQFNFFLIIYFYDKLTLLIIIYE